MYGDQSGEFVCGSWGGGYKRPYVSTTENDITRSQFVFSLFFCAQFSKEHEILDVINVKNKFPTGFPFVYTLLGGRNVVKSSKLCSETSYLRLLV